MDAPLKYEIVSITSTKESIFLTIVPEENKNPILSENSSDVYIIGTQMRVVIKNTPTSDAFRQEYKPGDTIVLTLTK